ncbi:1779_t:CDS:2 [Funneliformis geosporum]|uniref:1779_t:CDS:1 n=1 Tax=Funneliformis geosporum TaxID=1117311 RepID=A0A9W4SF64_9GLOM|nr:1779_t:CDS:2 [Funneliformis geosporum]
MHNFPIEFSLNDTPIKQISTATTTVRCQRNSSCITTGLVKCNNNQNNVVGECERNRQAPTLLLQEYQVEEDGKYNDVKNNDVKGLIQQLLGELQQTKALVVELESRLELTEQTSQEIVEELKNLLSENESVSHTTAVDDDQELENDENMKIDDLDKVEFYHPSSLIDQTHKEETIIIMSNEREIASPKLSSPHNESTVASTSPSELSTLQHADDTDESIDRICTQSWSSNVGSWIINHYNPSPVVCECGLCWLCLESSGSSLSSTITTARTTPKSSRANSISLARNLSFSLKPQQESDKRQVQLARIKKQYRKKLEGRFDYRKSCEDLEMELQKLITTAISTGVEHGLMNSPVYQQFHDGEGAQRYESNPFEIFGKHEQFRELEKDVLNNDNGNVDHEKKSSKWRRRIWNCLQNIGVNFVNDKDNTQANIYKDNVEEEDEDNENNGYSSYSSYNSSWNPSSRDYRENSNEEGEDSSNPFPSSFINTLNFGQNIFNFNVNLVHSTTNNYNKKRTNNYFNDIDNSSHSTSLRTLALKSMNFLAMIGFMFSMSQAIGSNSPASSAIMNIAARNIRSRAGGRRSGNNPLIMIKVIKYIAVLFVGWAAGRSGKRQRQRQKESFNESIKVTEL